MKFTIIAVLGRPSARVTDFFNSIKFHNSTVEADSKEEALLKSPNLPADAFTDGYEVLNWYAFEAENHDGTT